ncbi:outer membrane protein assembly factor BamB family protein [Haloarchaeobius iranensis]|uniref:outer membrane protein assembly factor BamB family protein n=1 Tax=Haloarchaeobius iranensis TaxID=996166 RepID=UPI0015874FD9|nr:PQQ-binding-like beta-propeller repeat protein [Haloarchaeobius iranensis]
MFLSSHSDRPLPEEPTGEWTQYGVDGANTFSPDVSAPANGNLAWTSDAFTRWQPVVSDGTVYMTNFDSSRDGSAIALDAQDGTEQWRTTLGGSESPGSVFVDDLFIVAYETELVALDSQTGEQVWTKTTNGLDHPELLVAEESTGTVLIASDTAIEAFEAATGEKRWETNTVRDIFPAPAVYDGRVFAVGEVDEAPYLVALSMEDGSEHWRTELTAAPESAAPVVTEDGIFVDDNRTLIIYDRETGDQLRQLYSFDNDSYDVYRTVAVDDGTVFVSGDSGAVAIDSETGTERWHRDTQADEAGLCVGTETVVFPVKTPEFAPDKKTISAFDRESGEMRWYYGFDPGFHNSVTSQPVLVDGAVFFTSNRIDALGAIGDVPAQDS